jgi:hypothetical protein
MIELAVPLVAAGLALTPAPSSFGHRAFCEQMLAAAAADGARPGTPIDRLTRHGGMSVHCEDRAVEIRTLLDRPAMNGGVRAQERRWRDDHCSDPEVAEAIANKWIIKATILYKDKVIATFRAACGGPPY